jgi:hypothetical protein
MKSKTVKQFSTLMWRAISPCEYALCGYETVRGKFNGDFWQLNDVDMAFRDMEQLSKVVEVVAENFTNRGNKWG